MRSLSLSATGWSIYTCLNRLHHYPVNPCQPRQASRFEIISSTVVIGLIHRTLVAQVESLSGKGHRNINS